MKINWSIGGIGFEVGGLAPETKTASGLSMLSSLVIWGGGTLTARDGPRLKPWHDDVLTGWKKLWRAGISAWEGDWRSRYLVFEIEGGVGREEKAEVAEQG